MKPRYYLKHTNLEGAYIPQRANPTDAGYDVLATTEPSVVGKLSKPDYGTYPTGSYDFIDYIEYGTNLYFTPEAASTFHSFGTEKHPFHTDLRARSSISKYNLVLANSVGLIDMDYKNQVMCRFKYIWQPEDYRVIDGKLFGTPNLKKIYQKGDKIAQILAMETHEIDFYPVEFLPGADRGGGFGTTGK